MSGVEVIGLLASVSQLAGHALNIYSSISEIYHKIQNAPRIIQEHAEHIKHLIKTAELINEHELLQTDCINSQIISTLNQARLLSATLDKVKRDYLRGRVVRRYWKIVKGDREKEILASLKQLDQERSALVLCISIAHTDLLGTIRESIVPPIDRSFASVPTLQQREYSIEPLTITSANYIDSAEIHRSSSDNREDTEKTMDQGSSRRKTPSSNIGFPRENPATNTATSHDSRELDRRPDTADQSINTAMQDCRHLVEERVSRRLDLQYNGSTCKMPGEGSQPSSTNSSEARSQEGSSPSNAYYHLYENSRTSLNGSMHNGDSDIDPDQKSRKNHYKNPYATDDSMQFNGNSSVSALKEFLESRKPRVPKDRP